MSKRNKVIIGLSTIGAILLFLFIFFATFSISRVEVIAQQDNTLNIQIPAEERMSILNSTKIKNKQMIFNVSEQKVKENVEKSNPQYKVIDVEKKFPNKIYINVKNRTGIMKVDVADTEGISLVIDEDMFVIAEITPSKKYNKKLLTVDNYKVSSEEYNSGKIIGKQLDLTKKEHQYLNTFVSVLIKPNKNGRVLLKNDGLVSFVSSIDLAEGKVSYFTYSGLKIELPVGLFKFEDFDKLVEKSYVAYREIKNQYFANDDGAIAALYGINNNKIGYFSGIEFFNEYKLVFTEENKCWEIVAN